MALAEKITVFGTKISLAMTKYAALLERLAPVVERMLGSGQKLLQVAQRLEAFAPKAIELAQAAAKSANTIKVVVDNVQRAFAVRKLADRVIKFTNDAGQIADTAHKAYDQASGSAQTAGGAEPDATDAATAVQEPVTEPVP